MTEADKNELLENEPSVASYLRKYYSAVDFINQKPRYCLWLKGCSPVDLRQMPLVMRRVDLVRKFRMESTKAATVKDANIPTLFSEDRQPNSMFLAIPKTTSERRKYIPIGFMQSDDIVASELFTIADANLYHFGILNSLMHMSWTRTTCGRLKSDYRYSAGIVYNNFPWPTSASDKHKESIEKTAKGVLSVRDNYQGSSLADLYDPLTMPPDLVKAHQALDRAVDAAYVPSGGKKSWRTEAERVAFLFELHQKITSLLPEVEPKVRRRRKVS